MGSAAAFVAELWMEVAGNPALLSDPLVVGTPRSLHATRVHLLRLHLLWLRML